MGIIYRLLQKEKASKKHVILLSDGDTHPADFQKIIDRMKEADISISTVTIGLKGNPSLMKKIAEFGGGKNYIATDIKSLPQLFIEETNRAAGKSFSEEIIKVNLRNKTRSLSNINFADAPELNGKISMKEKSTAEVLLQADDFSPLLAKWQYGAGKVFVFGSDVTNRWGAEWIGWDENQKFWVQLIRNNLNSLICLSSALISGFWILSSEGKGCNCFSAGSSGDRSGLKFQGTPLKFNSSGFHRWSGIFLRIDRRFTTPSSLVPT